MTAILKRVLFLPYGWLVVAGKLVKRVKLRFTVIVFFTIHKLTGGVLAGQDGLL